MGYHSDKRVFPCRFRQGLPGCRVQAPSVLSLDHAPAPSFLKDLCRLLGNSIHLVILRDSTVIHLHAIYKSQSFLCHSFQELICSSEMLLIIEIGYSHSVNSIPNPSLNRIFRRQQPYVIHHLRTLIAVMVTTKPQSIFIQVSEFFYMLIGIKPIIHTNYLRLSDN